MLNAFDRLLHFCLEHLVQLLRSLSLYEYLILAFAIYIAFAIWRARAGENRIR